MDEEIQKIVQEYVKQIESKEADLVFLQREIDKVIFLAQKKVKDVMVELDAKFDENSISEEEYLSLLRAEKEKILLNTKESLDKLVQGIEGVSTKREKGVKENEDEIKALRKKLNLQKSIFLGFSSG